jgi:hypothetical protein
VAIEADAEALELGVADLQGHDPPAHARRDPPVPEAVLAPRHELRRPLVLRDESPITDQ